MPVKITSGMGKGIGIGGLGQHIKYEVGALFTYGRVVNTSVGQAITMGGTAVMQQGESRSYVALGNITRNSRSHLEEKTPLYSYRILKYFQIKVLTVQKPLTK